MVNDLTVIYLTANVIPYRFAIAVQDQLILAIGDTPLISVSKQPMSFGENICVGDTPRSTANIYRQLLAGAKAATTKYVGVAEDDVLYSPEHFKYRPKPDTWAYNMNAWSIFTWGEPMFTYKYPGGRRNLSGLICERELLVNHLEERFKLWPDEVNPSIFGEPGKYDNQLGTTPYPSEYFCTNPPNIVFSHQSALGYEGLGKRKRVGEIRATSIPYWEYAEVVRRLYK